MSHSWRLSKEVAEADCRLARGVDEVLADAVRLAGRHLACRRGCTPCCTGVFDITALDGARLVAGFVDLAQRHPRLASGVGRRAREAWRRQLGTFPGDPGKGILRADEGARERFFGTFGNASCPALSPRSGACLLYRFRPLSCRTYGLPIACGEVVLPPCPLNFHGATLDEIDLTTVDPDPTDKEGQILARLRKLRPDLGDTTVTAVLSLVSAEE